MTKWLPLRAFRDDFVTDYPDFAVGGIRWETGRSTDFEEDTMGKTGRKRRARKKKSANHGKRPNS